METSNPASKDYLWNGYLSCLTDIWWKIMHWKWNYFVESLMGGICSPHSLEQDKNLCCITLTCRSLRPCGIRRRSAAARLLRLWVRIPPGAWMSVCCECCVLSGRGLSDELDHSSREVLPTVVRRSVWSRNLVNEEAMAHWGLSLQKKIWRVDIHY